MAERQEVEVHLASCAECRAEVRFHRSLGADLRELPRPTFPAELEEVLVRAAVQTRRSLGQRAPGVRVPRQSRVSWIPILCGAAGLAIVGLLILLLLPGRMLSPGTMDEMAYGGGTRGTGVMSDALMLIRNLRQGWSLLGQFLSWCSPVASAAVTALQTVGAMRWAALAVSLFAALFLLRRVTKRRSVGHAKVRGV